MTRKRSESALVAVDSIRSNVVNVPVFLAGVVLLSGCVTSTDPSQGGFINGVSGLSSGTYDQRIQTKQNELSSIEQANARLEAIGQQQSRTQASLVRQIGTAQAEYDRVNSEIFSLQSRLNQLRADGQSGAKLNSTQTRLKTLQSQAHSLGPSGSQADAHKLAQITHEINSLQSSLDSAFGVGVGVN